VGIEPTRILSGELAIRLPYLTAISSIYSSPPRAMGGYILCTKNAPQSGATEVTEVTEVTEATEVAEVTIVTKNRLRSVGEMYIRGANTPAREIRGLKATHRCSALRAVQPPFSFFGPFGAVHISVSLRHALIGPSGP
jgi:hypothetical protein